MEKRGQFTNWAIELQSLAQDGLEYGHDRFDLERYTRIREIATEMMSAKTGLPIKQVEVNLLIGQLNFKVLLKTD